MNSLFHPGEENVKQDSDHMMIIYIMMYFNNLNFKYLQIF